MKKYKLKTYKVDGETRVGIWINDNFVEEVMAQVKSAS